MVTATRHLDRIPVHYPPMFQIAQIYLFLSKLNCWHDLFVCINLLMIRPADAGNSRRNSMTIYGNALQQGKKEGYTYNLVLTEHLVEDVILIHAVEDDT